MKNIDSTQEPPTFYCFNAAGACQFQCADCISPRILGRHGAGSPDENLRRAIVADPGFPRGKNWRCVRAYLIKKGACMGALDAAERLYAKR